MGSVVPAACVYRFGMFVLNSRTGELANGAKKTLLREQPLRLLLALLEHPGDLVTREELVGRLWPEGTFVDFDRGLNKAVNHLREALGDSAEQPNFIETLPRKAIVSSPRLPTKGVNGWKLRQRPHNRVRDTSGWR